MPVHRGFDFEVVPDEYFDIVAFIHINQRARLLAVDEVYLSLESICKKIRIWIFKPYRRTGNEVMDNRKLNLPGERESLWTVKLNRRTTAPAPRANSRIGLVATNISLRSRVIRLAVKINRLYCLINLSYLAKTIVQ